MAIYDDQKRKSDDTLLPEDAGLDLGPRPAYDTSKQQSISQRAGGAIDDIDKLLAEEEAAGKPDDKNGSEDDKKDKVSPEELGERESEGEGGFDPDSYNYEKAGTEKGRSVMRKLGGTNSKLKKRFMLAGAAAGGSVIAGIFIFLALLPLKIEHLISNLDSHFGAAAATAIDEETTNALDRYMVKQVMPGLGIGGCHSTIDASCTVLDGGQGPVGRLFNSWKQGRIEQKLATKYGIVIGRTGDGVYHLNVNGQSHNIRTGGSVFDLDGTTPSSRSEIRRAVRAATRDATLSNKIWARFKLGPFLARKYGIKQCVIFCDSRDKFNSKVDDKKLAAKAFIIQRVITPASANYGLIANCIITNCSSIDLNPAAPGDADRLSPAQAEIKAQLLKFSETFGKDSLEALVKTAQDIGRDGIKKVVAREVVKKIATSFGGEAAGAAAGDYAAKAINPIGWIFFAAKVVHVASDIGPAVKYISYASGAAAAVALYSTYNTVASETKSGHVDATELASLTTALNTNLTGKKDDRVDMTQTPIYDKYVNGGTGAKSGTYKCDDGNTLPAGTLACPEENFSRGNDVATNISDVANFIPGLSQAAGVISAVGTVVGEAFGAVFNAACNTVGLVFNCPGLVAGVGGEIAKLVAWVTDSLIQSPFSDNMSGGRSVDMIAAGDDVSKGKSCQLLLGCAQVTDQQIADIRNDNVLEQKTEFANKPFTERMFDTGDSNSLVSHVAMAMPTDMATAVTGGAASLLGNPFGKLGSVFSSVFSTQKAFAAETAQPDPFGVVQYAYAKLPAETAELDIHGVPKQPDTYWDAHCKQFYNNDTGVLDVSGWLNEQPRDDNTGEPVAKTSNPCLLINSTAQSAGGLSDPGMLPKGDGGYAAAPAATNIGVPNAAIAGYGATVDQLAGLPAQCKTGSATGAIATLCFGAKYRNMVRYLEVHNYSGQSFSQHWPTDKSLTLDCSLFISAVIYETYGVDLGEIVSQDFVNKTQYFQKIPIAQAQPGDLAVDSAATGSSNHVAFVVTNGTSRLDASMDYGLPANGIYLHPKDLDIHGWQHFDYALRYIGPNAGAKTP